MTQADPIGNTGSLPSRMVFGDYDNDGDKDAIYQNGSTAGAGIGYLRNNGDRTFTNFINAASAGTPFASFNFANQQISPTSLFPVDYDFDGDTDLVDRETNGGMGVWRNDNGAFSLQSDPLGATGSLPSRMVFGDFDSDGDEDILYQNGSTAGTGIGYFRNDRNGAFANFTNANAAGTPFSSFNFTNQQVSPTSLFDVDYDNDGDTDLVDRDNSGGLSVWRNDEGSFSIQSDPLGNIGTFPSRMIFADFDSDGDQDILYQNGAAAGAGIGYFKNNGSGGFTNYPDANSAGTPFDTFDFTNQQITPTSLFAVDYEKDGDVDIIDRETNGGMGIFEQTSDSGADGKPPRFSSSVPANAASGVNPGSDLTIVFDEPVTKGTGNITIVRTSDNSVFETIPVTDSRVNGAGTTWTLNPTGVFASNTAYAVRISLGSFVDTDGAVFFGINNNTLLNFTTGAPTAAPVTVSGRVTAQNGRALKNVRVELTDSTGSIRYAMTNPLGYYRFTEVAIGDVYLISAFSKQYLFLPQPQVVSVYSAMENVDFEGYQVPVFKEPKADLMKR